MSNGTIEIITGTERRRRWSADEKLRIVAEAAERVKWKVIRWLASRGNASRVGIDWRIMDFLFSPSTPRH
jgi:hypothetical protein